VVIPIGDDLSYKEKTLLTLLGENPDTPTETLIEATGYHHQSTLSKKKRELIKNGYLKGPYYYINLNAVGENELYDVYADI
jgi:DNA-binding Lrp family transcriptional regulator